MVLKKKERRNYWKKEEEILLKQWGDKSQCYQWMHMKARDSYQRKNALYTIPVIIISTLTGTANFAQERFSDNVKPYVAMVIGSLSIIAGIITTVSQFLKVSELNESHRVASLSWGKFYRDINAELIRHPLDRIPANEFIKSCKEEYTRLVEISPFIPNKILTKFNNKFKNNTNLVKPEIGNTIHETDMYIMDSLERKTMVEKLNKDINMQNLLVDKKIQKKQNKMDQFKESFFSINHRYPTQKELEKNIKYISDEEELTDRYEQDKKYNIHDNTSVDSNESNQSNESKVLETTIDIDDSQNNLNFEIKPKGPGRIIEL